MNKKNSFVKMAGHREGDVEVWYDSIKEHTFKTEFVELTEEGGRAFQSLYFGSVSEGETNLLAELEVTSNFANKIV